MCDKCNCDDTWSLMATCLLLWIILGLLWQGITIDGVQYEVNSNWGAFEVTRVEGSE